MEGTDAGFIGSLKVTANESPTATAPFLFVVTRFAADVVGAVVSHVNVRTEFADTLPAVSIDHAVTV